MSKRVRKIIEIDEELCDGCGQCVPACAEGAIEIVNGKARLVAEKYCDGLGACLGECPKGALRIVERPAEEFDEEAVKKYLEEKKKAQNKDGFTCPSARLQFYAQGAPACETANIPRAQTNSALCHWPIQIRLVPPTAPFLKGARLLVAADCTPVAYPRLHEDFLQGRIILLGCPKFDDPQGYIEKFSQIFAQADIKDITALIMEVPCCGGLPVMIKKGMELAGKDIPLRVVTIGTRGAILREEDW
ncbi:4Fe-4S ferredoxin [Thermosulfuriphilus ammonigenes]|uniref:4Fe-4S ferredoxin n=1 Tax=Thermosulfuriphilus ammonigenes TaxID=1936021 RepID=A0A6G7PUN3_9BACT|nr:4Fe-4S binding protein [Thermosulfuriphilus ammonigenes]MBA2848631.1 Fe-S-cluster-containing hydrogenase component 2 [Thermosulfuriphilus ammonigenes]QIJ71231.1 4Fe-4S ferredoxin [Thermosulfuriphilus ammonigenes]